MEVVNKYLKQLQEQDFSASVDKTDVHGEFQKMWTECFRSKCLDTEHKYERAYCKSDCMLAAANRAITTLNASISNCTHSPDPKRCVDSLRSGIEKYQEKKEKAREMQDNAKSRMTKFRQGREENNYDR